jgi:hypothetical protein
MNTVNGLPTHVLLIHAVVVLVPTAALAVIAAAWSASLRRRLGLLTPALALGALVLVPITANAGQWLQKQVPGGFEDTLILKHADRGEHLWPWVLALFLLAAAGHLLARRAETAGPAPAGPGWLPVLVAVLATVAAVGATVQTARIGDSGARAVWEGTGSS